MTSAFYEPDHDAYRQSTREFLRREVLPHFETWREAGLTDRSAWQRAGAVGLIGMAVPEEFGGAGIDDFKFRMVISEEAALQAVSPFDGSISIQDDIVIPYILDLASSEQKKRWLPGLASGELIGAIAMTEPDTGSDLQAIRTRATRTDGGWLLNGQKTFISNGIVADLVIVVARTDPEAGSRGFSLLVVERGTPGFERGRSLKKIGLRSQDTAELSFEDAFVTDDNVLGAPGHGFEYLMQRLPRERMSIAALALAGAEAALQWTLDYTFGREAFGRKIADFQNTRFKLAEMDTELKVTRSFLQEAALALNAKQLSAVDAARAKWWTTELSQRVTTQCVQLFGGYGYMDEYPIARHFADARIQTIYGGTTEIMKEIIGRDLAAQYASRTP